MILTRRRMVATMLKDDVLKHFGGCRATAKALGLTPGAVSQWAKYVPERVAMIMALHHGKTVKMLSHTTYLRALASARK